MTAATAATAAVTTGDEIVSFRFRENAFLLRDSDNLLPRNILFICTYRRGYAQASNNIHPCAMTRVLRREYCNCVKWSAL